MVGRGAIGQPWIIAEFAKTNSCGIGLNLSDKINIIKLHIELSMVFYGIELGLKVFRKHLAAYIEHLELDMAADKKRQVRADLCRLNSQKDIIEALDKWIVDRAE